MTSFFNRVFGKNAQPTSRRDTATRATISSSTTAPLIPLDLPYVYYELPNLIEEEFLSLSLSLRQWIPPDFNRDSIRLLVFLDSDDVGTELVFDSKTLRVVVSADNENTNNKPLANAQTRTSLSRVPTVNVTCVLFSLFNSMLFLHLESRF